MVKIPLTNPPPNQPHIWPRDNFLIADYPRGTLRLLVQWEQQVEKLDGMHTAPGASGSAGGGMMAGLTREQIRARERHRYLSVGAAACPTLPYSVLKQRLAEGAAKRQREEELRECERHRFAAIEQERLQEERERAEYNDRIREQRQLHEANLVLMKKHAAKASRGSKSGGRRYSPTGTRRRSPKRSTTSSSRYGSPLLANSRREVGGAAPSAPDATGETKRSRTSPVRPSNAKDQHQQGESLQQQHQLPQPQTQGEKRLQEFCLVGLKTGIDSAYDGALRVSVHKPSVLSRQRKSPAMNYGGADSEYFGGGGDAGTESQQSHQQQPQQQQQQQQHLLATDNQQHHPAKMASLFQIHQCESAIDVDMEKLPPDVGFIFILIQGHQGSNVNSKNPASVIPPVPLRACQNCRVRLAYIHSSSDGSASGSTGAGAGAAAAGRFRPFGAGIGGAQGQGLADIHCAGFHLIDFQAFVPAGPLGATNNTSNNSGASPLSCLLVLERISATRIGRKIRNELLKFQHTPLPNPLQPSSRPLHQHNQQQQQHHQQHAESSAVLIGWIARNLGTSLQMMNLPISNVADCLDIARNLSFEKLPHKKEIRQQQQFGGMLDSGDDSQRLFSSFNSGNVDGEFQDRNNNDANNLPQRARQHQQQQQHHPVQRNAAQVPPNFFVDVGRRSARAVGYRADSWSNALQAIWSRHETLDRVEQWVTGHAHLPSIHAAAGGGGDGQQLQQQRQERPPATGDNNKKTSNSALQFPMRGDTTGTSAFFESSGKLTRPNTAGATTTMSTNTLRQHDEWSSDDEAIADDIFLKLLEQAKAQDPFERQRRKRLERIHKRRGDRNRFRDDDSDDDRQLPASDRKAGRHDDDGGAVDGGLTPDFGRGAGDNVVRHASASSSDSVSTVSSFDEDDEGISERYRRARAKRMRRRKERRARLKLLTNEKEERKREIEQRRKTDQRLQHHRLQLPQQQQVDSGTENDERVKNDDNTKSQKRTTFLLHDEDDDDGHNDAYDREADDLAEEDTEENEDLEYDIYEDYDEEDDDVSTATPPSSTDAEEVFAHAVINDHDNDGDDGEADDDGDDARDRNNTGSRASTVATTMDKMNMKKGQNPNRPRVIRVGRRQYSAGLATTVPLGSVRWGSVENPTLMLHQKQRRHHHHPHQREPLTSSSNSPGTISNRKQRRQGQDGNEKSDINNNNNNNNNTSSSATTVSSASASNSDRDDEEESVVDRRKQAKHITKFMMTPRLGDALPKFDADRVTRYDNGCYNIGTKTEDIVGTYIKHRKEYTEFAFEATRRKLLAGMKPDSVAVLDVQRQIEQANAAKLAQPDGSQVPPRLRFISEKEQHERELQKRREHERSELERNKRRAARRELGYNTDDNDGADGGDNHEDLQRRNNNNNNNNNNNIAVERKVSSSKLVINFQSMPVLEMLQPSSSSSTSSRQANTPQFGNASSAAAAGDLDAAASSSSHKPQLQLINGSLVDTNDPHYYHAMQQQKIQQKLQLEQQQQVAKAKKEKLKLMISGGSSSSSISRRGVSSAASSRPRTGAATALLAGGAEPKQQQQQGNQGSGSNPFASLGSVKADRPGTSRSQIARGVQNQLSRKILGGASDTVVPSSIVQRARGLFANVPSDLMNRSRRDSAASLSSSRRRSPSSTQRPSTGSSSLFAKSGLNSSSSANPFASFLPSTKRKKSPATGGASKSEQGTTSNVESSALNMTGTTLSNTMKDVGLKLIDYDVPELPSPILFEDEAMNRRQLEARSRQNQNLDELRELIRQHDLGEIMGNRKGANGGAGNTGNSGPSGSRNAGATQKKHDPSVFGTSDARADYRTSNSNDDDQHMSVTRVRDVKKPRGDPQAMAAAKRLAAQRITDEKRRKQHQEEAAAGVAGMQPHLLEQQQQQQAKPRTFDSEALDPPRKDVCVLQTFKNTVDEKDTAGASLMASTDASAFVVLRNTKYHPAVPPPSKTTSVHATKTGGSPFPQPTSPGLLKTPSSASLGQNNSMYGSPLTALSRKDSAAASGAALVSGTPTNSAAAAAAAAATVVLSSPQQEPLQQPVGYDDASDAVLVLPRPGVDVSGKTFFGNQAALRAGLSPRPPETPPSLLMLQQRRAAAASTKRSPLAPSSSSHGQMAAISSLTLPLTSAQKKFATLTPRPASSSSNRNQSVQQQQHHKNSSSRPPSSPTASNRQQQQQQQQQRTPNSRPSTTGGSPRSVLTQHQSGGGGGGGGSGYTLQARQEQRDLARDGAFEGTSTRSIGSSVPHLILKM